MTVKVGRRSDLPGSTSSPFRRPPLSAISDEAAALHCEHFRRGPTAVKSYMTDDLVVCVLSGILTPTERTLIGAGEPEQVRWRRTIHELAFEETYTRRMAATIGCPVSSCFGTVCTETDVAVYIFTIGSRPAGRMPNR
jgi:uncharacterized protein YbcI